MYDRQQSTRRGRAADPRGGETMNVAVIGAGRIGANIARRLAGAGHALTLAFARDLAAQRALAGEIGARVTTPGEAGADAGGGGVAGPWSGRAGGRARAGAPAGGRGAAPPHP